MKKIIFTVTIAILLVLAINAQENEIRFNSIGFLPDAPKKASVIKECKNFEIVEVTTGKPVLKGKANGPVYQKDVDQNIWILDFSKLTGAGEYYIYVDDVGKSKPFKIDNNIYDSVFSTVFRGMYLWRCGTSVETTYHGNVFKQDACHLNDGYEDYTGNPGSKRDGTGGWHDAGDYGKYVSNAGVSMGLLFNAWSHFEDKMDKIDFDIPETAPAFPDYLEEMKWETDWLLKMQYPDGSGKVSHKLTRLNFSPFIMPQDDIEKRYFSVWGTTAIADFVAMMSMASRLFKPYDAEYAQKCLEAAKLSYDFLQENPEYKRFEQGDFRTGSYQSQDWDDRIWAAAEMWEATGEDKYLKDFENRISELKVKSFSDWDWQNVTNLGVITYLSSKSERKNAEISNAVKMDFLAVADSIVSASQKDVYARPLGDRYYWGCNGTVARQALNLQMAYRLTGDEKYKNTALDAIGHIFGRNFYNRSFVTGIGVNPPMHPHDRRCGADGIDDPWPGYIVGGGHTAIDWIDEERSYSHNEIALNWQAALIYALAGFISQ